VNYEDLLNFFWRIHDPTTPNRQGNDTGSQYRSAIFYHTPEQQSLALKIKEEIQKAGKWKAPIITEIVAAGTFWKAEEYHQAYLDKNPGGYCNHRPRW
jgi:methionine-S-sulfoxide reductase